MTKEAISTFWNSAFDPNEIGSYYNENKKRKEKILSNFNEWQKKTKEKPNWSPKTTDMISFKKKGTIFDKVLESS